MAVATTDAGSMSSAYYEDALVLVEQGEPGAAVIQLKNALLDNPDNLSARLLLGNLYIRLSQFSAAINAFESAAVLGADESLVIVPLFRAHLHNRDYQIILGEMDLTSKPRSVRTQLLVIRGHANLELGNYVDAEANFKEAAILDPGSAAPLTGKALVRFNRGNFGGAEALIKRALEIAPDAAATWFVHGEIKRVRHQKALAVEKYTRALAINPDHYKARLARAGLLIDLRQFEEARTDLDFLSARNRNDPQVTYFKALRLLYTGEWEDAGALLDEALAIVDSETVRGEAQNPQHILLSGVVRLLKGDHEHAYRLLSDYVDLVPDDPSGRLVLGRILLKMQEPARTLSVLKPVLSLDPSSPELHALMGTARMQLGNYSEATQHFDEAIARSQSAAPLHVTVAKMKISEGDQHEARTHLFKSLKLTPGSLEANYILACLELKDREFAKAHRYAQTILTAAPSNPTGNNLRGIILLAEGEISQARTAFEAARDLSPGFFSPNHNLAQLDLAKGDLKQARSRYEDLLKTDSRNLRAMIELVKIARYTGDKGEAIERLETIRIMRPGDWQAWKVLADIYLSDGDQQRASAVVEQLERLAPDDPEVLIAVGRASLAVGAREDALRTLGRASVYAKQDPGALGRIAKYMIQAGGQEAAENTLKAAIRHTPGHLDTQVSLVALYANQNRFSEAFAHAAAVRKSHPNEALGHLLVGDIHMRKGAWEEALKAYRSGVGVAPTAQLALRIYRAEVSLDTSLDGRKAATQGLQNYSARDPGNRDIEIALASAMNRAGDSAAAQGLLERLLSQDAEDVTVLNNLAGLYTKIDDPRAVEVARRAWVLQPEEAAVLDTLGWALVRSGQVAEALAYLRDASVRATRFPEIHYHLAVALEALGRPGEALREVNVALKSVRYFDDRQDAEQLAGRLQAERLQQDKSN